MEEEQQPDKNNFCKSCKKYHRTSVDGTCPVCGDKLTFYRPKRNYWKDDTLDERKKLGRLINIDVKLNQY